MAERHIMILGWVIVWVSWGWGGVIKFFKIEKPSEIELAILSMLEESFVIV